MDFSENLKIFNAQVETIDSDNDLAVFSRIVNRLLNETFLIGTKERDKSDYYFVYEHMALFNSYLGMMDYECACDVENRIAYVKSTRDRNRYALRKFDTVVCLILRRLFHQQHQSIKESSRIIVPFSMIDSEIQNTGIFPVAKTKTDYINTLRTLRRLKLIDYITSDNLNELNIEIFPTILVAVSINDISNIAARINALKKDQETDDEAAEEDTID